MALKTMTTLKQHIATIKIKLKNTSYQIHQDSNEFWHHPCSL